MTRRIGVIGSSGGAALAAADACLRAAGEKPDWVVMSDRPCGIEDWAQVRDLTFQRVGFANPDDFSSEAVRFFDREGCDDIILFFTRRVSEPLISAKRVWNIHPSILPAFSGLHGVRDAIAGGARLLGATLHRVDKGLDTGPIVAQVVTAASPSIDLRFADYLSYLQKVWLILLFIEQSMGFESESSYVSCGPGVALSSPGLADSRFFQSYAAWIAAGVDPL